MTISAGIRNITCDESSSARLRCSVDAFIINLITLRPCAILRHGPQKYEQCGFATVRDTSVEHNAHQPTNSPLVLLSTQLGNVDAVSVQRLLCFCHCFPLLLSSLVASFPRFSSSSSSLVIPSLSLHLRLRPCPLAHPTPTHTRPPGFF